MPLYPTPHIRFILRNGARILQQWWTSGENYNISDNPDGCTGEWQDVPLV